MRHRVRRQDLRTEALRGAASGRRQGSRGGRPPTMKTSFTASAAAAGEDRISPASHVDSRADRGVATPSPAPLAEWPLRAEEVSATHLTTASLPPSTMRRESTWAAEAAEDAAAGVGEAGEAPALRKNGTEKIRKRSAKLHHTILRRF